MNNNNKLKEAKIKRDDEFYTNLEDIENELKHYKKHFKDKVVYCNCDDAEWSNFFKYFKDNFFHLKLKKLISTHYSKNISTDKAFSIECTEITNSGGVLNEKRNILTGDGDFRTPECIELLKQSDIVCTNPPFSLFREYIQQLVEHNKQFLIIGSENAITYKEVFPLVMNKKIWLGNNHVKEFRKPNGEVKKFGNVCWYTNLNHKKQTESIVLWKEYKQSDYQKYENYDAIEVSKVAEIPNNYYEVMGVPITFLSKYNPIQFEIIGMAEDNGKGFSGGIWDGKNPHCVINGKNMFKRIFIKARKEQNGN